MSAKNQQDLLKRFYEYTPGATLYTKPSGAGKKVGDSGKNKRRVRLPDPELFEDRVVPPSSPVKIACVGEGIPETETPQVGNENSGESSSNIDLLFDPDREVGKEFSLYHRSDTKNVPKSVKRCQSCERSFIEIDILVVKTHGVRQYFCGKSNKIASKIVSRGLCFSLFWRGM